ncbi:MAG TPA: ATP-binding protein [Bryobacteraceae bacterium]|nr:ATP-binding protein [Bryobacteraceae bacterium]
MKGRLAFAAAAVSFLVLLTLVIWQGSFHFPHTPADIRETVVLWAVSTLIFLLMVTLAFMLFRALVKLYIDRQSNREGARIRSRLIMGALALALTPVLLFVFYAFYVLNRTLDKWFSQPARTEMVSLQELDRAYWEGARDRAQAEANWIAALPETALATRGGTVDTAFFRKVCAKPHIDELTLLSPGLPPVQLCPGPLQWKTRYAQASAEVTDGTGIASRVVVRAALNVELAKQERAIATSLDEQQRLAGQNRTFRWTYVLLDCVITLFVLYFAWWLAQIMSRQIIDPITALLEAAREVRQGNLSYRVRVNAIDDLATLVRAFNDMTNDLETNAHELEARRRFTEAILESIPTGVISVSADEQIERVNRAMFGIFPRAQLANAKRLGELFAPEDLAEIRYLMKRARRAGASACQLEIPGPSAVLHLALTVASVEERRGFVIVVEDTSDLLRAQKAAAWQEVARRIAHEIKNPLTPISLCADRIARLLGRLEVPMETREILAECTQMIQREVQTVKSLVDEFSQFSRFPAARPSPADLNEIVESAMAVFAGRLDGITVTLDLDRSLPVVMADREQIKRVIVNLVDNAAEAMSESPVRRIEIATAQGAPDAVELSVTDTGCGVSATDKEKLFLPYFSTKDRGTGLGLAIVSHVVREHRGRVRVEDNLPVGARFVVELSILAAAEQNGNAVAEHSIGFVG